ncbi:alpha/beta hydrolase [Microbacterium rhizophilus]|uniref:alpha/beta hydrolase n=1 Tax=Microbacterium rhizophilus TaxID=3138934 RepID=UPI0031E6996F
MSGLPADAWATLRAHARTFTPEAIAEQRTLLGEILGDIRAPHVERDVAYGEDERQRFDLHALEPLEPGAARPIILFVHGGGFVGGDKRDPVLPFFDNVGAWAAGLGWIAATMTYRRAPDHVWPAGAQDVGSAVRRLREDAPAVGGDPDRIVLFGHSAGAAHVAGYIAGHGGPVSGGIAGVALQSGIYDPVTADDEIAAMVALYYGDDRAARSPLAALAASRLPLFIGTGEHDPLAFQRQAAAAVVAVLAERGALPFAHVAPGHSHFTSVLSLGADETFGAVVARFIRRALGDSPAAHEGAPA